MGKEKFILKPRTRAQELREKNRRNKGGKKPPVGSYPRKWQRTVDFFRWQRRTRDFQPKKEKQDSSMSILLFFNYCAILFSMENRDFTPPPAAEGALEWKSTKARVRELMKRRGPGNVFSPSTLSEAERKQFAKLSRKLRIKARNEALRTRRK